MYINQSEFAGWARVRGPALQNGLRTRPASQICRAPIHINLSEFEGQGEKPSTSLAEWLAHQTSLADILCPHVYKPKQICGSERESKDQPRRMACAPDRLTLDEDAAARYRREAESPHTEYEAFSTNPKGDLVHCGSWSMADELTECRVHPAHTSNPSSSRSRRPSSH